MLWVIKAPLAVKLNFARHLVQPSCEWGPADQQLSMQFADPLEVDVETINAGENARFAKLQKSNHESHVETVHF